MSNRVKRTVFVNLVFHINHYLEASFYKVNENVFSSTHEEYFFHSTEVKQLWVVPTNLANNYDLTFRISEVQRTSTILLPKISITPEDSLIDVTARFPFSGVRQNLEFGINHFLKVAIEPRPTGDEVITINCFAEETGLAYDLTTP